LASSGWACQIDITANGLTDFIEFHQTCHSFSQFLHKSQV
jgi:hypothetical protein